MKEKKPNDETKEPKSRRFHSSRAGRFFKISTLTGKVSTSYLGQKIKKIFVSKEKSEESLARAHLRNAHRGAKTMGQLKGAVMKVGQMMSLYADILPKEFTDVLSTLQKQAPPVHFRVIQRQIETELERPLDEIFESLDEKPFASASIGQVHRGMLKDGREVSIKVQYPGVDRTVDSDIKNLRTLIRSLGLMKKERGVVTRIRDLANPRFTRPCVVFKPHRMSLEEDIGQETVSPLRGEDQDEGTPSP